MRILVFGGTTEGREAAEELSRKKIQCDLCVATEYGSQVVDSSPYINLRVGRLDSSEIESLVESGDYSAVIDATHPFATSVSENIFECVKKIPLVRIRRDVKNEIPDGVELFSSVEECILALEKTSGKILLTTGSKNLLEFCAEKNLRERIVARVLPAADSFRICEEAGLLGKQIIAMQGPFSKKMNETQIEDFGIEVLVTKESGKTGGADSKIQAALSKKIKCFVIKNPETEKTAVKKSGGNYRVCPDAESAFEFLGISSGKKNERTEMKIFLCGIGMGGKNCMTAAVKNAVETADVIFGAQRMLDAVEDISGAKKIPCYTAEKILPALDKFAESTLKKKLVAAVLFSGDTGFFSGAEKLSKAFAKKNIDSEILPGISSIQYFSSKIKCSWNDAEIFSTHGIEEKIWEEKLKTLMRKNENPYRKIFFITSGFEDVEKIISIAKNKKIAVGFNLSYPDEEIFFAEKGRGREFKKGLYCGMIFMGEKAE